MYVLYIRTYVRTYTWRLRSCALQTLTSVPVEKTDVLTSATTPTAPTCVTAERATMWTWTATLASVSGGAGLGGVKSGEVCCGVGYVRRYVAIMQRKCKCVASDTIHSTCMFDDVLEAHATVYIVILSLYVYSCRRNVRVLEVT